VFPWFASVVHWSLSAPSRFMSASTLVLLEVVCFGPSLVSWALVFAEVVFLYVFPLLLWVLLVLHGEWIESSI
jgi:hypothetical protein